MRVLIVDDDPTFRQVLTAATAARGHQVTAVGTFDAALEAVAGRDVDVLVTDHDLDDPDGRTGADLVGELSDDISCLLMSGLPQSAPDGVTFVRKSDLDGLLDAIDDCDPDA